jgi:hypothetical protein
MVFKMTDTVLASLAQPTFRRHESRRQFRVQLVMGVGVGTMRNLYQRNELPDGKLCVPFTIVKAARTLYRSLQVQVGSS